MRHHQKGKGQVISFDVVENSTSVKLINEYVRITLDKAKRNEKMNERKQCASLLQIFAEKWNADLVEPLKNEKNKKVWKSAYFVKDTLLWKKFHQQLANAGLHAIHERGS
jgi:hypothetical protein